jgi:hypothetical protein
MHTVLPPHRAIRTFTVGITAAVSLYALVLVCAEPFRGLAAADSENVVVSLTVAADISNTCTTPVSLGTITRTGDTGVFDDTHDSECTVTTNNTTGYNLTWLITTGTGAAGARTGTGHLNGFTAGNRVKALFNANNTTPAVMDTAVADTSAGGVQNSARWAGRLSSTSTTAGGGSVTWGADGGSETYLRVATGSSVQIANRTTQTSVAGDTEKINFRAIIHGTAIVPTDVYKATVVFTATTN